MHIDEAAKSTRRYAYHADKDRLWRVYEPDVPLSCAGVHKSHGEAQAHCDRLNLLAVLEAIREPSERMVAAARRAGYGAEFCAPIEWRAMIDALIAEVKGDTRRLGE